MLGCQDNDGCMEPLKDATWADTDNQHGSDKEVIVGRRKLSPSQSNGSSQGEINMNPQTRITKAGGPLLSRRWT